MFRNLVSDDDPYFALIDAIRAAQAENHLAGDRLDRLREQVAAVNGGDLPSPGLADVFGQVTTGYDAVKTGLAALHEAAQDLMLDAARDHIAGIGGGQAGAFLAAFGVGAPGTVEGLNDHFAFEMFVIGPRNRFAHAAAVSVAEEPGMAFNPLTIYGGPGLGKTHLLCAIGRYVRKLYPGMRILPLSGASMRSLIERGGGRFSKQVSTGAGTADVMLVDDIHLLEGDAEAAGMLLGILRERRAARKQIVLTADRTPSRLDGLPSEFREFLESGLITYLKTPNDITRIAINKKRQNMGLPELSWDD